MRAQGSRSSGIVSLSGFLICLLLLAMGCRDRSSPTSRSSPKLPTLPAAISIDPKDPARLAAVEERHQWNLQTLVGDYMRAGSRSPRWDEPAKKALELMAWKRVFNTAGGPIPPPPGTMSQWTSAAHAAGCDDPMVLYFYARMTEDPGLSSPQRALLMDNAANEMDGRDYSTIRKLYAHLRAAEYLSNQSELRKQQANLRRHFLRVQELVGEFAEDETAPFAEISEAIDQVYVSNAFVLRFDHYDDLEKRLLRHWGKESWVYQFKGRYFKDYAWKARGGGWASSVSEDGWRLFGERLQIAERALMKSWEMNPSDPQTPIAMITVEMGMGESRERMEEWFSRAMQLSTNSWDACDRKMTYLEPKWHGSVQEMLKFGRECAQSKRWGGSVPLMLYEAHRRLANYADKQERDYWANPAVWKELQPCFQRFFARSGDEGAGWHHNYALLAYKCRQWDVLNQELNYLGEVNYKFFGGRQAFDRMKQEAEEHAPKAK